MQRFYFGVGVTFLGVQDSTVHGDVNFLPWRYEYPESHDVMHLSCLPPLPGIAPVEATRGTLSCTCTDHSHVKSSCCLWPVLLRDAVLLCNSTPACVRVYYSFFTARFSSVRRLGPAYGMMGMSIDGAPHSEEQGQVRVRDGANIIKPCGAKILTYIPEISILPHADTVLTPPLDSDLFWAADGCVRSCRCCLCLTFHTSSFAVDLHSLRAAGLAFNLRTSAWVMRDLAVYIGDNGLGLQLDVRYGGVKVDGHTPMPPGVSNSGAVSRHFPPSLVAGSRLAISWYALIGYLRDQLLCAPVLTRRWFATRTIHVLLTACNLIQIIPVNSKIVLHSIHAMYDASELHCLPPS